MSTLTDRYRDLLPEERDDNGVRAIADFHAAYKILPPPHLRAAIDRTLRARIADMDRVAPVRRVPRTACPRQRMISLVMILLLAFGGLAGYLRLATSTPVSAQAVLRRAAALRLAPHQAAHLIYGVVMDDQVTATRATGTADVWIRADAHGTPTLFAQTLIMHVRDRHGTTQVHIRYLQTEQQVYVYDAERGTIMVGPSAVLLPIDRGSSGWVVPSALLDGIQVARYLSTRAQGTSPPVRLQLHRPLDGHLVDAVTVENWLIRRDLRTTFYFDTYSSVLRGFDAVSVGRFAALPVWHIRLRAATTLAKALSSTFMLHAPASARIALPTISARSLVLPVLLAPRKPQLDVAVAAGQITRAQEATALAALRAQRHLERIITLPTAINRALTARHRVCPRRPGADRDQPLCGYHVTHS